ncbi:MAG: hypothetical protein OJF51_003045 [Nitrospira sp.]|nr:MAG: hypothetical protein OJF51_003045 [Nitrospira sp.]
MHIDLTWFHSSANCKSIRVLKEDAARYVSTLWPLAHSTNCLVKRAINL